MNDRPAVRGHVVVDRGVPAFANGTVHVRLEEIRAADAPARVAAETVIRDISHRDGSETEIPFTVGDAASRVDGSLEYRVRVWIDRESRGHEAPGDLHSDVAHPVLTRGADATARVWLGRAP